MECWKVRSSVNKKKVKEKNRQKGMKVLVLGERDVWDNF